MATLPRRAALAAAALLAACHAPSDDYDRFIAATADARQAALPIASSHFEDLSGRWFVDALLAGGLQLGLRMHFTVGPTADTTPLSAEIWLAAADPAVDPPLTTTQSTIGADGRFTLLASPLILQKGSVKGLNVDVRADVIMDNYTQSKDEWCGAASGKVTDPLELDLAGSTLGALRDDAGTVTLDQVPVRCPAADMM